MYIPILHRLCQVLVSLVDIPYPFASGSNIVISSTTIKDKLLGRIKPAFST